MTDWPVDARVDGPIVMIGFGSIGKSTVLPLKDVQTWSSNDGS